MSFFDTVINSNPYQTRLGKGPTAFAAQYPIYEQTTPQYPAPNPYNLAHEGYRTNELVYACIEKRLTAISDPPLEILDITKETPSEIKSSPLKDLLANPCEGVTGATFWKINELNLLTAGFSIWEKERTNGGDILNLWPMRPDWCSFLRGDGRPIRAVRYAPYGLPPQDIDRDDLLIFMYYDPRFPLLKGLAPTAVALRTIGVDNSATNYLANFFRTGAVVAGLLTTDQSLSDPEGTRIRERWKDAHGGVENWGDIAVLGKGATYQNLGMNFRDMAFDQLDGRDEARICAVMKVPPILVGAKVGLQASTYSNYEQAREAFYEETITPEWKYYEGEVTTQLVPEYHDQSTTSAQFNLKKVKALQEDRDKAWTRAINAAKANLVTRDEGREEMGLDPIDDEPVFVGATVRVMAGDPLEAEIAGKNPEDLAQERADLAEITGGTAPQTNGMPTPGQAAIPQATTPQAGTPQAGQQPGKQPPATPQPAKPNPATEAAKALERKQFREYLKSVKKSGHRRPFHFSHLDPQEQAQLLTELPASNWRNYP